MEKIKPEDNSRKTLLEMLGLPETATDAEMTALIDKEHKGFDLGEFKRKAVGAKAKETAEETSISDEIKKVTEDLDSFVDEINTERRPDILPNQVENLEDIKIGGKYRIHTRDSETGKDYPEDVMVVEKPYLKSGNGYWVAVKNLRTGQPGERNCEDMGVSPYLIGGDGKKRWNPRNWMEAL